MKQLILYLKKYRLEAITAPLLKLTEAVFELLIPILVKQMIDVGIGEGQGESYLRSRIILMAVFAFCGFLSAVTAQYCSAKASVGVGAMLRERVFGKIQHLSCREVSRFGVSTLMTRLTGDVQAVETGINLLLRLVLRAPIIVIGATVCAIRVSPNGALPFYIIIPLLTVFVFLFTKKSIPIYKNIRKENDRLTELCRDQVYGVRLVRAFCTEEADEKRFEGAVGKQTAESERAGAFSSCLTPISMLLINGGIVFLFANGGTLVNNGILTTGTVVALVNYMSQILTELVKFANTVFTVSRAVASSERIEAILQLPDGEKTKEKENEEKKEKKEDKNEIVCDGVSYSYRDGGEKALSNLHFRVKRGEIIGIIGGTGSGKTTLAQLLAGLLTPTDGSLTGVGENIAYAEQTSPLFAGTVESNLRFARENATKEEMETALRLANADGFVKEKGGLSTAVEKGGANFSGGQRQRLSLARAFLVGGDTLILDDSFSALDYQTEGKIRDNLKHLPGNPTVFLISQRTTSLCVCDRILVLEGGRQVGFDTYENLLKSSPVFREIDLISKGGRL